MTTSLENLSPRRERSHHRLSWPPMQRHGDTYDAAAPTRRRSGHGRRSGSRG